MELAKLEIKYIVNTSELDRKSALVDVRFRQNVKSASGVEKAVTSVGKSSQNAAKGLNTLATSTGKYDKDAAKASRTIDDQTRKLSALGRAASSIRITQNIIGGRGGPMFGEGIIPGLANISNIIQGIPQIGNLAGAIIRPLTDAAEEGVRLNMTLETAELAFTQVAGSAQKAREHLMALQAFGARSPFRFEGLLAGARLMTTFGFAIDEQIPKLRIWGDAIAAGGEITEERVHRVVTAFGQMRMAGKVNAQDMLQLTNANIPGWQLLAKAIGKTVAETRKLSEQGKLNGKVAVEAITAMMAVDKRFEGFMEKMQRSTPGRISALEDMVQIARGTATQGLTTNISESIQAVLDRPELLPELAANINAALTPISGLLATGVKTVLTPGITTGFTEGLKAGKAILPSAIFDFAADGILGPFKRILGIESPSKVFISYGLASAEGYRLGFTMGLSNAERDILGSLDGTLDKVERLLQSRVSRALGSDVERLIQENAKKWNVPEDLIRAVIRQESGGRPGAVSHKGAVGLMQLMPATARRFGASNRRDPAQNISAGTQYLRFLLDLFGENNLELVLAGYNAGEGAVQKYGNKVPPYAETQNYVRSIMAQLRNRSTGSPAEAMRWPLATFGPSGPLFMGQSYDSLLNLLTPEDLAAQTRLSDTIKATMDRLAAINSQITVAEKALAQARPETAGAKYSTQSEYAAAFQLDRLKTEQASLTKSLSSLNTEMQQLLQSTVTLRLAEKESVERFRSTLDLSGNVTTGPELLSTASIDPRMLTLNLRPLKPMIVESAEAAKKLGEELKTAGENAAALGPGQWYEAVTAIGSMQQRLSEFFDTLPENKRFMEDMFISLPSRFGDVIGDSFQRAGTDARSFFQEIGQEASAMWRSLIAEMLRQFVTRSMTKLFMGMAGRPEMNPDTGEATGNIVGGWGWLNNLGSLFGLLPKRAFGGPVAAGRPVIVGDHPTGRANPEIFIPRTSGEIIPLSQMSQQQQQAPGISRVAVFDDMRQLREWRPDWVVRKSNRKLGRLIPGF